MANNQKKLKAFVRYDGSGRVVASSLILRKQKPRVGRWYEIPEYLCCNGTTNTTTTQGGGVTPTAYIKDYWTSVSNACNSTVDGNLLFYSASSTLDIGAAIFTDAALTVPVTTGWVINIGAMSPRLAVAPGGVLSQYTCPSPSSSFTGYMGGDLLTACTQSGGNPNEVLYANAGAELGVNTRLYSDSALTIPYNGQYGQYYNVNGTVYQIGSAFGGQGYIIDVPSCPSQESGISNVDPQQACNGVGLTPTVYYSGSLGNGTALYTNPELTVPYNPNNLGNYIRLYFQAANQVCTMNGNLIQSYTAC